MWFVDHPKCNANMGAPSGMETTVGTLRIRDLRQGQFGGREMTSYWKPDAEDLKVLNAGGTVALTIHSPVHPVISMAIEPPAEPKP